MLSHHTSRYLAQVKAGKTLRITERGRVVAVVSPAGAAQELSKPRPRIGGYRSAKRYRGLNRGSPTHLWW